MDMSLPIISAIMDLDIAWNEELYLSVTDGRYLPTERE